MERLLWEKRVPTYINGCDLVRSIHEEDLLMVLSPFGCYQSRFSSIIFVKFNKQFKQVKKHTFFARDAK